MFRYLNKGDVFAPVLELVALESPRDNMLSSACLELFEYMRKVSPSAFSLLFPRCLYFRKESARREREMKN